MGGKYENTEESSREVRLGGEKTERNKEVVDYSKSVQQQ